MRLKWVVNGDCPLIIPPSQSDKTMKRLFTLAVVAAGLMFTASASIASAYDGHHGSAHHGGHSAYYQGNYGHGGQGYSHGGYGHSIVPSYGPSYGYQSGYRGYSTGYAPGYSSGYAPSYGYGNGYSHGRGIHLDVGRLHILGGHH